MEGLLQKRNRIALLSSIAQLGLTAVLGFAAVFKRAAKPSTIATAVASHSVPDAAAADSTLWLDHTLNKSDICKLHRKFMIRTQVPVIGYGYFSTSFRDTPYPHGGQPDDSGCSSPRDPCYSIDWVCPLCKQEWEMAGRPLSPESVLKK